MSREEFVVKEQQKLEQDRTQVAEELNNLREMMQAEVDVEPDEGDAEIQRDFDESIARPIEP